MRSLGLGPAMVAKLALVALTACSIGCAQVSQLMPGSPKADQTPAERQMAEDNARFNETVLGGALVGAVAGGGVAYVFCKIMDGSARRCNQSLAAGTVVGGAAGAAHGHSTATTADASNKKLRENEAILANLQRDNANLKKSVESSRVVLQESRQRLKNQKNEVARGRKSREQAQADLRRAEANRDLMKAQVDKAEKALQIYKDVARDPADRTQKVDLDRQIKTMETQIATMEEYIKAIDDSVRVNRV